MGKVRHCLFRLSWGTKYPRDCCSTPLLAPLLPPLPPPRPKAGSPSTQQALGFCAFSMGGSLGLRIACCILDPRDPGSNPTASSRSACKQSSCVWTVAGTKERAGECTARTSCPCLSSEPSWGQDSCWILHSILNPQHRSSD